MNVADIITFSVNINLLFVNLMSPWDTKQTTAVAVIYMPERMRGSQTVNTRAGRDWLIMRGRHVRCPQRFCSSKNIFFYFYLDRRPYCYTVIYSFIYLAASFNSLKIMHMDKTSIQKHNNLLREDR